MADDGFIYFISNPAFPGLLKIGMTMFEPRARIQALDTTGLPAGFVMELCFRVRAVRECESALHTALADCREKNEREFFRIEPAAALTRSTPTLLTYLCASSTEDAPLAAVSPRIPELTERVLAFIADCHPSRRAYTYDIAGCLGIPENEAIFQLGELRELAFVKSYAASKGMDYSVPLHKGLKYLKAHPVRWDTEDA